MELGPDPKVDCRSRPRCWTLFDGGGAGDMGSWGQVMQQPQDWCLFEVLISRADRNAPIANPLGDCPLQDANPGGDPRGLECEAMARPAPQTVPLPSLQLFGVLAGISAGASQAPLISRETPGWRRSTPSASLERVRGARRYELSQLLDHNFLLYNRI